MTRILAYALLGPLIGLGVWCLVFGFFLAGTGIRALERVRC